MRVQIVPTLFILALSLGSTLSENGWEASPKDSDYWRKRHNENLNTTATLGKDIKAVFIGSSSIDKWRTTGKEVWESKYAPLGVVNYGIRGDKTSHLIWRVENGELDGLTPNLVVIYIACVNRPKYRVNNCVRGVNAAIDKIHEKVPNSNLLYVSFFPRGDRPPINETLRNIRNITDTLKPTIDGDTKRKVHFLDLFWSYAPESMDRIYDELYAEDKLHQNLEGYKKWESLMSDKFNALMETK